LYLKLSIYKTPVPSFIYGDGLSDEEREKKEKKNTNKPAFPNMSFASQSF